MKIMYTNQMKLCAAGTYYSITSKLVDPQNICPIFAQHIHAIYGLLYSTVDNICHSSMCYDYLINSGRVQSLHRRPRPLSNRTKLMVCTHQGRYLSALHLKILLPLWIIRLQMIPLLEPFQPRHMSTLIVYQLLVIIPTLSQILFL